MWELALEGTVVHVGGDGVGGGDEGERRGAGAGEGDAGFARIGLRRAPAAVVEARAGMVRGLRVRVWRRDDDALTSFLIFS